MIKQLQNRFVRIAVVSLTVAMILVVGIVNVANWISVQRELSDTLYLIVEAEAIPLPEGMSEAPPEEAPAEGNPADQGLSGRQRARRERRFINITRHLRNMASEASWFSGLLTENGDVGRVLMDRMENLSEENAKELIRETLQQGRDEGRIHDYLYLIHETRTGNREAVLLNCETRLTAVRTLVMISAAACAGGIMLAWALVRLASRKAIEPTIRNMEQQKQFITNASHELKTPLTVIATNMELLQMETEDNPWVLSTLKQTAALRKLVDELVYLSRMEEAHPTLEAEKLDPGSLLEETAEPFAAMAEHKGRELRVETEKGLQATGDRAALQRLISTLCDNAVKYASGSPILAELRGEGKNIVLRVSNPVEEPLSRQECEQLFNRFYRTDPSRSKEKQRGFGIGLAIAAAITEKHGGRISAAMEGDRLVFTCVIPKEMKQ